MIQRSTAIWKITAIAGKPWKHLLSSSGNSNIRLQASSPLPDSSIRLLRRETEDTPSRVKDPLSERMNINQSWSCFDVDWKMASLDSTSSVNTTALAYAQERMRIQLFHHAYWRVHNAEFLAARDAFIHQYVNQQGWSEAEALSAFYRHWADMSYSRHRAYHRIWMKRNVGLLGLASKHALAQGLEYVYWAGNVFAHGLAQGRWMMRMSPSIRCAQGVTMR